MGWDETAEAHHCNLIGRSEDSLGFFVMISKIGKEVIFLPTPRAYFSITKSVGFSSRVVKGTVVERK